MAFWFVISGSAQARLAAALLLGGNVYLMSYLLKLRLAGIRNIDEIRDDTLALYREHLNRQRLLLRHAGLWCCGALLPASFVALFGQPVYPYWLPLVVLIAAEANLRQAQQIRWRLAADFTFV